MSIELVLLILAILLLLSILASKISDRVGVPALLLFLALGMLAGSDGVGGIYFDNAFLAQGVGVIALALILFSGGLDTEWRAVRPVLSAGIPLALVGVFITALVVGLAAYYLLGFPLLEGLLLGATVSSTDAAAVFSVLRSRGVSLKEPLRPLLELESGSNDPMAVFLTIGLITLITNPDLSPIQLIPMFLMQMGLGAVVGYGMGRLAIFVINRIQLGYDGLYPVLALALCIFTYGLAAYLGGSGFLAVYLAGMVLGNSEFVHRRSLLRFFDGLAWLMQIAMFLTLGLLVFPTQLPSVVLPGLMIAVILILIARPLGVFVSLIHAPLTLSQKTLVAWVGLRGAAPIVLATFPMLAGIANSEILFNLVFFVVLSSVLIQGPSIPWMARKLNVDAIVQKRPAFPIEPNPASSFPKVLRELFVPTGSPIIGKRIVDLGLPRELLVILISRKDEFVIVTGVTEIQAEDCLLVIASEEAFNHVRKII